MLDDLDKKIIEILKENSKKSLKDIADQIHLSISATKNRIDRLENSGYIKRYTILTNDSLYNEVFTCLCFIELRLDSSDKTDKETEQRFLEFILNSEEVDSCHRIIGKYQYVIRVITKSMSTLESFLIDLREQSGVSKTVTYPVLSTQKYNGLIENFNYK